jgi:hypothetical protein
MKYVLVSSRHSHKDIDNLPAIFNEVVDIFDYDLHKKIIHSKLKECKHIALYVTGLTQLLVSVLNYCRLFNIEVTLFHYDVDSNRYRSQSVI